MTIEERLENMERELGRVKRRSRWLLGAILLVAGGLIAPGMFETTAVRAQSQKPGAAKEVHARSFVIEDENGKVRAVLRTKDGPMLCMYDEKNIARAFLGVNKDGTPGLSLFDEKGKSRADLVVFKGGSHLSLFDENGKSRVRLTVSKTGPQLSLFDENGKSRAGLTAFKDGPSLTLSDENGTYRVGLGVFKEGPGLVLWDENSKVIWSVIK